jgi:O-antigen/teichoic acid export membrane protein
MAESLSATSPSAAALPGLPILRVARKGAMAIGIKLLGAGAALVLQVFLARMLGHAGYGEFAYVFAWLQLALIFSQAGFSTAAVRYVAEYRARRQPALVRGFVRRSSQLTLLQAVVLAVLMAACASMLNHSGAAGSTRNFLIASAALPVLAQAALSSAVIRGFGHAITSMLVALAQPLTVLGLLLTTGYLFRYHVSPAGALWMYLAAAICSLALIYSLRRRFERDVCQDSPRLDRGGEWLGTATQMLLVAGLIYLQGRTGVIFSGLLLDAGSAGTYAAMERLADAVLLGLTSLNLIVAPRYAALYAQGRRDRLQRQARLAAWGSTCFMLAAAVPLVAFGKPLLRLFGEEFVSGYPVLLILLGGAAVNAMCGSVAIILNMTGHQRDTAVVAFSSLCLNLILSLILIPRYGITGTAVAFAASMAWWNLAMLLMVQRRIGIWCCVGHVR